MKVTVLYFASCRDIAGKSEETIELPEGSTVRDLLKALVLKHPRLAGIEANLALSVNMEYAGRDAPLADGDEVALIPPVSGGSGGAKSASGGEGFYAVVERPIDLDEVAQLVRRDSSGAVAAFGGVVRSESLGRAVVHLEYEAYAPMAERTMAQIGREVAEKWPVDALAILHRVGRLAIGEMSVAIAVASPHRKEALEACAYVIERLKEIVPIWKKEVFADGEVWAGRHGESGEKI